MRSNDALLTIESFRSLHSTNRILSYVVVVNRKLPYKKLLMGILTFVMSVILIKSFEFIQEIKIV